MEDRRRFLAGMVAGAAGLPLSGIAGIGESPAAAAGSCAPVPDPFVDAVLVDHEGRKARFWSDLVRGRTVLVHFTSAAREARESPSRNVALAAPLLGERLGRDVFLYSITSEPESDGPRELAALASRYRAAVGWRFLTGDPADIGAVRDRLFASAVGHAGAAHKAGHAEDCSAGLARYGNASVGIWGSVPLVSDPAAIAARLAWVSGRAMPAASHPPRRGGPHPPSRKGTGR